MITKITTHSKAFLQLLHLPHCFKQFLLHLIQVCASSIFQGIKSIHTCFTLTKLLPFNVQDCFKFLGPKHFFLPFTKFILLFTLKQRFLGRRFESMVYKIPDGSSKISTNVKMHAENKHIVSAGYNCPICHLYCPNRNHIESRNKHLHL